MITSLFELATEKSALKYQGAVCIKQLYIFFHPDYTVGFGISPNQPERLADYTAGGDFHPALKTTFNIVYDDYLYLSIGFFIVLPMNKSPAIIIIGKTAPKPSPNLSASPSESVSPEF